MLELFRRNKIKILMSAPLIVGFLFFIISFISAFITIKNTKLPDDFKKVSIDVNNYQIQQIDEKNNQIKWILNAKSAKASTDETKAQITKPKLVFFSNGQEKFTIIANFAELDKAKQEVKLFEDVVLSTSDASYTIKASEMFFSESNPYVEFAGNWNIENKSGYQISGTTGKFSKDQKSIISENNAQLTKTDSKQNLKLLANKIVLEPGNPEPIKAFDHGQLIISTTKNLKAQKIFIQNSGLVKAFDSVQVSTENMVCYSNNLEILPNADKSPRQAIFTGNPHIIQEQNSIYSDKIIYDFATNAASIEGNVHSGQ